MELYRDKRTGKKLYPVCSWNANQHKLYYFLTKFENNWYDCMYEDDADGMDKWEKKKEEMYHLLTEFNSHVHGGIAYATYEDGQKIKEACVMYDIHH